MTALKRNRGHKAVILTFNPSDFLSLFKMILRPKYTQDLRVNYVAYLKYQNNLLRPEHALIISAQYPRWFWRYREISDERIVEKTGENVQIG